MPTHITPHPTSPPRRRSTGAFALGRRDWLRCATGIGVWVAAGQPTWAQGDSSRTVSIAQVVDMSPTQQDVSRDFLTGSRVAWQDTNARGGIQGKPVQHMVLETDGTPGQLRWHDEA